MYLNLQFLEDCYSISQNKVGLFMIFVINFQCLQSENNNRDHCDFLVSL